MKVFLKVVSIILIVLGVFNLVDSIFIGAITDVFSVLFGPFGMVYVVFSFINAFLALGCGICGCNFKKIPKVCYILGIILGLINLVIIGINLFVFQSSFNSIYLLIINFVLAVLYLIPIISLKKEA